MPIGWLTGLNLQAGTAIWLIVFVVFVLALLRRRTDSGPRGRSFALTASLSVTVLILFGLGYLSWATDRRIAADPGNDLSIHVDGRQFWWLITYNDSVPPRRLTTANELVIPTGRSIGISLTSRDVIHSFWAPEIHGKVDLIPGYTTRFSIRVDSTGVYQGRCAEFCGLQHAKMQFLVIAIPPDSFAAWYDHQLQQAVAPADSVTRRGQEILASASCGLCHTVRGTPANGQVAPDLTHLASRRTIAAGALPNTRGNLAGWILDPQRIKPGNHMPRNRLPPDDFQALLAYLETLK